MIFPMFPSNSLLPGSARKARAGGDALHCGRGHLGVDVRNSCCGSVSHNDPRVWVIFGTIKIYRVLLVSIHIWGNAPILCQKCREF